MRTLFFLGLLAISTVLMTATCPRSLEKELFGKLGRKVYQVLRRGTDRPEIAQAMMPIPVREGDFEEAVANRVILATCLFKDDERALLFCNSRDECDRMGRWLGWRPYHSSVSTEECSEAMKLWKDGAVIGLVCTSMLNCCLDYPHIRYVFHLGPPRDVVDYYQAIGRAA
jgi:superfamily II DNA helicase RecQ